MAVFEYQAVSDIPGGRDETGTIVARDKLDAFHKLKGRSLTRIRLKRLAGLSAVFKKMTADIR